MLRAGCAHMRQAFDIESINLDELIATALDDPKAVGADIKAFHGINFGDLNTAYHEFCKNETVATPVVDMAQVITFYNNAAADLPDPTRLKGRKLPSLSVLTRRQGQGFRRRVRAGQPARLDPARRGSGLRAKSLRRRRRPALLHPSRRRRARPHPRLHRQPRRARPAAGRLDHHPAGGEEPAGRRGRDLRAQDPRDDRRVAAREHAEQIGNSRALHQLRLSRPRRLGHRDGRAQLFRQIGEGAHARRRRHAGGPAQGPELLQSRTVIPTAPRSGSPTCSAACRKTASSPPRRKARRWRRRRSSSPSSGRGAKPAFISSISSAARPRPTACRA